MLSVTPTPVELIDDDTATTYYNEFDTLEGAERESRAEALRLWADQKDADQKREQFDTLNKIYSDFDGYVNDAGLQDFDEDSRYRTANRQFIASQFDQTPEEQQDIYSSFRDKWTESVVGKKGMSEKETFGLIKEGIDARNEVSEAANQIPGDIALSLFDSIGGNDPVDVPKLIETWKTKNADSIKKLPPGWEAPLLESAQAFHTETEGMLRDYAEPLKKVYDHLAAVTGRDTERAGETNPKNQEEMDSMVDTLASMPKPVRERAYASVVLGAQKAGQDPKKFMEQWGESWSRTLNMLRTGALTAQEMAAESDLRMLEDKTSPPDYYISKSTGKKIPLANRAFYDEADLRKVAPEEIAAEADQARQKVKRFEVVRELQSVADNQFDPIEKINKGGFLGFMEAMAYGSPQGLAYTATALVPVVGPYIAGAAMFSDEYNQLRQQGMSVDQAVQIGSVSAAVQAGMERTGAKAIFGKLPAFEKLMRKIGNPARVGKAGSAGVRFLAAATGEQLVEGAQDLTTPLVQDVSEALGADVPDVKWQPILEKWGGSRLDVLAASLPTILLGTGVATFADNKRFAQFEERQDRYRMTGMDDATIKKIEDGKDLSEVQQNFQSEFGKLTPENVKAGIAYMEGKIASAKDQQEDPNTHTLTRETLADGSKKFVIRDPKGDVRYTTGDEQTAQIALSELLRTQITGTTRGIFESISFFNQVNEVAGRGEDVQKFLLSNAPRNLLTDYEANPTEQNLNNLFETVRAFGQDISEPAELANFPVLASNQGVLAEGIFKSVIQIHEGATGDKVVRDVAQDNLKRAIAEGRIKMEWVRENLNQIIPQIDSKRITGYRLRTETDTDVIESFSDVALAYMVGDVREDQIPEGFRGFLRRMAIIVKDIYRRAYNLKRLVAEGKVDANFETLLADSVGLNQQARVDTASNRVSKDIITDGGQMLMDFSIGSRASAVSTDTPSIRASNATITGPANYSIGAFHGTPHKVEKFSTGKIGTGEGAQAYGWGLYFAQEKDVADKYANDLSKPEFTVKNTGEVITETDSRYSDLFERYKRMNSNGYSDAFAEQIDVKQGNLYTVELDVEPEDLLDWDKPLSEQSEKVQKAIKKVITDPTGQRAFGTSGRTIYENLLREVRIDGSTPPKKASEKLASLGIPGIRYLDGDSRNSQGWKITPPSETVSGKWMVKSSDYNSKGLHFDTETEAKTILAEKIAGQTYNYVVFDENLIKITEENGNRIPASQAIAQPVSTDINYSIGSPAFSQWFGESKVVDSDGKPMVVYHGTTADVSEFTKEGSGEFGRGHYFAPRADSAAFFGGRGGETGLNIMPVYLSMQRPLRVDVAKGGRDKVRAMGQKKIREQGYDGIIATGLTGEVQYVVFEPTQIKSATGNRGTFDPTSANINYSIGKKQDADYLAAVERGDMKTAQKMADEAARTAGYSGSDHRMQHSAPDRESTALASVKTSGLIPNDYLEKPQFYQSMPEEWESFSEVRDALNRSEKYTSEGKDGAKLAKITVYRSVPKSVKEESIRNGDWVTPSKEYAAMEGRSIPEGYKIISKKVSLKNLWWDGNSIAELGFDDGKDYAYKNTKNNRKLIDPVTYDENGNVIPLSQRFNPRSADINYSIGIAPNGNPSNLTPDEQALTQSPEFKNWSGNLEVSEINKKVVSVVDVDDKVLTGKTIKDLRKNALQKTKSWWGTRELNDDLEADVLINRDTIEHMLSNFGAVQIHASLFVPQIVRSARKISDEPHNPEIPEVVRVHRLLAAIRFRGDILPVEVVVKEHRGPKQHHAYDIEAITVKTETAEQVLPGGTDKELRTGSAAVSEIKMQDLRRIVNSSVITVKTDENGEPLASEIARFRKETGTSSFSIASQSEIDRVNRALGGMNRGPDARLAVYERAKAKLIGLMQSNQTSLDDLRKGTVSFRRTQVLQALGELDAILSIFPPDLRGRVGGYTKLASIAPHDVFKDGEKVSEVNGMNGAIISAWMREGQNIGQAGQQNELPPGYTAKENLGTARADRAISDFFKKRIEMIDRELEKTLRREYDEAFRKLLDRTKPKKAAPGEKPKGIGGDIQDLFAVVRDSVDMNATQVAAKIAGLDSMIASGELTAEQEARAQIEAALVALTGDWKNADSDRRRTALTEATRIWSGAYAAHTQKVIRQREEREIARAESIIATGKDGDMPGRASKAISDSGLKGTWKDYILNLLNFDQVVGVLFGENSEFSNTIIDKQRLAENAKEDGSQTKMQGLEDFFSGLAGGNLLAGERLRYQLTQPSMTVNDIQMSQLEGLSAVMMWAQEDGRRHMEGERDENGRPSGKWNYDQAFVDEITTNLSAEALALRDWLSQQYAAEYANINAVYSELNGVNLPQIQNYSPVTVQPVNAPAGQVLDPVSGSAMSGASTSPGALRTRGTSIAEPRFQDALQTYIAHTLQMEHWKAFAPMLSEVNGILRNRDVQNSVQEKGGIEARKMLNLWLDYFGQGGNRDAGAHLALNQGLNNILGRASQVALVGRISTLLIQSTQLGAALAEVPAGPYLKRMGKLLSGQLSWDAALNSDYIQRRIKQMPPVVQMAMQGLKGAKPTAIQQAGKRLGMLLSGADGLFTAGTYAIVYDWHLSKAKELGLAGQQAEDYARNTAERATDRIAQPTRAGARSLYENTQTNPLARAGWAFASEARKNLALVAYSFAERDTATKLRTIAYVLALNAIGSQILRSIWRDTLDDDDEELFDEKYWNPKRFLMAAATEPLYGIPVFGSMLEEAVYKSAGEYNPQTSLFSVASAVGPIKRLPDHLSGDTEMRNVFSDIDKIISSLGVMHPNIAATASITHLAKDLFGLADSAVDATTED